MSAVRKLSPNQQRVLERMRAGATLYYQPLRAGLKRGYMLHSRDEERALGFYEDVSSITGNALVDKRVVFKDTVQANRIRGPWSYSLAPEWKS